MEATFQRSRKWLCNPNAEVYVNHGELFDALPFIPRTSRNETYKREQLSMQSMSNLERWFAQKMVNGDRNNAYIKYAAFLLMGYNLNQIRNFVFSLNDKISIH